MHGTRPLVPHHKGDICSKLKMREKLLAHVANELVTTSHANMRTLGGAGHPYMIFQMARRPFGALLVAAANGRSCSSMAKR